MQPRIKEASEGMVEAVGLLRAGGLVAFPTETVYGLGAHALDAGAVARIFAAKGRPANNPLIVHVIDQWAVKPLVRDWSPIASDLAKRFWPGPLTLVVRKSDLVPDIVTAGGPTVAVRVPGHPVALDLLSRLGSGFPVAAPSANRSTEISPTTAAHVAASLGDRVDLILDGGPTTVGLESTVVDVSVFPPRVLRSGMITTKMLYEVIGQVVEGVGIDDTVLRSPGMLTKHYAPRTPLIIVPSRHLLETRRFDDGVLLRTMGAFYAKRVIAMPQDAAGYAARLYAALREMDEVAVARIVVEEPPTAEEWTAIHDRLRRASAQDEEA